MATATRTGQATKNLGGQPNDQEAVQLLPLDALMDSAKTYVRENPESAALWCFGIGFVLGWKLKMW